MSSYKKRGHTSLSVHRCRFVDYAPSAITALAFPPLPLPSVKGKNKTTSEKERLKFGLLAVGHANGNIDICEWMGYKGDTICSQAWVVRKTLPGPYPSKVDLLELVIRCPDDVAEDDVPSLPDLRLFSSGGGSELIEWDLERGCIRRTISSQGGSIWSMAANPSFSSLALGCEDGTVRILSIADDALTHSRRFDRVKSRILSIAWGPPVPRTQTNQAPSNSDSDTDENDSENWTDSFLVTGCSDSSLRKWHVATGRVIERMGVERVRGERTLVWTVGVLGDGTIVSGDSMGIVKFWEPRTCTQLYSFQAHGADILCMVISPEGKTLYTSGVDQKVVQFSLVKTSSAENLSSSQWTQTCARRLHSHDVRAIAIWPPFAPLPSSYQRTFAVDTAPILASGGLDMSVVLTPAAITTSTVVKITNPLDTSTDATFEESYQRKLTYSAKGSVRVARGARLVSCAREAGLTVWRIARKPELDNDLDSNVSEAEPYTGGWEIVIEMDLNVHTNITAHEFSDDGRWLVVSDFYESKLFSIIQGRKGSKTFDIKKVDGFSSTLRANIPASSGHPASSGASAFQFSPDSSKLIISTALSSYILIIDLTDQKPRVIKRFDHHRWQYMVSHDRVITGRMTKKMPNGQVNGQVNGLGINGHADVGMSDPSEDSRSNSSAESDMEVEDIDKDMEVESSTTPAVVSVDQIAVSADCQWVATSDNKSRTHIFNLDLLSHHCTLPSFRCGAQALAFDPMQPSVLLLVFPDNTIQTYDVETRQFPTWGKKLSASLPKMFRFSHEPVLGAMFEPTMASIDQQQGKRRYVLFWGATWLFKISLDTRIGNGGGKRRRGEDGYQPERDYKMITQYRPIMCCNFLTKEELVVVERPLMDVLRTLPPPYFKHKYGS